MGEFDTLAAMFGDRFDRIEGKLDEFLAAQAKLETSVAVLQEQQRAAKSQFKTLLGALGGTITILAGFVVKFWHT